jgi:hypothetical protein
VTPSVGSVYIVETSTTDAAAQVLASSGSAVQVSVASESSTVAPTVGSVYIVETSRTNAAQVLATSGSAVQVSAASETSANSRVSQIARDLMSMSVSIETVEAGVSLHGNSSSSHLSVENSILSANNPLEFNETESLTVHGNTGLWLNRTEIVNWRGEIPITQYLINEDLNPEVIRKRTEQRIIYEQEVAVRYLRPPTPPPPGEILIRQEKNIPTPPAPPLVIRQVPPRPETPAPLVVREAPPRPPAAVGQKVITISGKRLPPPPRKVVIERLAPMPTKPQAVIIERWLPYGQSKRKVIFQKNTVADPVIAKPRNIIIQWDAPEVQIKKDFKDLGVIRANPVEYVERYGASLKTHIELPQFVRDIRPPVGVILAAEFVAPSLIDLEGDVEALRLIDLDQEGLAEYRAYLARFSSQTQISSSNVVISSASGASVNSAVSVQAMLNAIIMELFQSVDTNKSGQISRGEAESLLLRLNIRLGRNYTQTDASAFVRVLDVNGDGVISFEEFRSALLKSFS